MQVPDISILPIVSAPDKCIMVNISHRFCFVNQMSCFRDFYIFKKTEIPVSIIDEVLKEMK